MPLGTEHALVAAVSVSAIALGAVFAGIWWTMEDPKIRANEAVVSPAPFDQPPFCEHRIESKNGLHQIIVRVNALPENPLPPPDEIEVQVSSGSVKVANATTDVFGCASIYVGQEGSYVFEARAEQANENATHEWWSNAVTRHYDGRSPAFFELRLNNYARYA